jgi:hypothetical protein
MEVNHKFGGHRFGEAFDNKTQDSATDNFLRRTRGAPSGFFEMSLKAKVERELHEAKKDKQKLIQREYIT